MQVEKAVGQSGDRIILPDQGDICDPEGTILVVHVKLWLAMAGGKQVRKAILVDIYPYMPERSAGIGDTGFPCNLPENGTFLRNGYLSENPL